MTIKGFVARTAATVTLVRVRRRMPATLTPLRADDYGE